MEQCNAIHIQREQGLRVTARRTAVLDCLIRGSTPLTAGDVHGKLSGGLTIDPATVYRILGDLAERGVLRVVYDSRGVHYYEIACKHNPPHAHFRCRNCNRMDCLGPLDPARREALAGLAGDREVAEITVTLVGVCDACRKEGV